MTQQKNESLSDSIKKLEAIVEWFETQEEVDVEKGLEKFKEGAALVKSSRERLKEIENEFRDMEHGKEPMFGSVVESPHAIPEQPTPAEVEPVSEEERKLQEAVLVEQYEARERFGDLIDLVSKRYGRGGMSEKMLEEYIAHNAEVLGNAVEIGVRKGFSPEELRRLEVVAVLHDLTKADAAPEAFRDIPNYVLALHGEAGAQESLGILTDEYLDGKGFEGDRAEIRQEVSRAIREHMGPHPGFMDGILAGVNAKLRERSAAEIVHPKAEGRISEAMLAVDMCSLAGEKGRKKIMAIRAAVPVFRDIDQKTVEEYATLGIELSMGEAALLSGFESAFQARDMLRDSENRKWLDEAIEASKGVAYGYGSGEGEETARWAVVELKQSKFEDLKRTEQMARAIESAKS
jgi:exonuclease VII small subunit